MKTIRFGEYLVQKGLLSHPELNQALNKQREIKDSDTTLKHTELGNILLLQQYITEEKLCEAAENYKAEYNSTEFEHDMQYRPTTTLNFTRGTMEAIKKLGYSTFYKAGTLPVSIDKTTRIIELVTIAEPMTLELFVERFKSSGYDSYKFSITRVFEIPFNNVMEKIAKELGVEDSKSKKNVYKLTLNDKVQNMFRDAVRQRASDIFIVPMKDRVRIKFKIDTVGQMYSDNFAPADDHGKIANILLQYCGLPNSVLNHGTADGAIESIFGELDRSWSARLNFMNTVTGYKIVARLIPNEQKILTLTELGMPPDIMAYLEDMNRREAGLVMVTGHMGSGKNTTIYATLLGIDAVEREVVTIEDPVERRLEGISQGEVNTGGLTFSNVASASMRQAIDVLFIGEIRDKETINLAVNGAGAGMLIFSTIHIDRVAQIWSRVYALDPEALPRYITALEGIMTQKLVRKICEGCKVEVPFDELDVEEREYMDTVDFVNTRADGSRCKAHYKGRYFKGTGCPACSGSGTKGVTVITEILPITYKMKLKLSSIQNFVELEHYTDVYMEENKLSFKYMGANMLNSGIISLSEAMKKNIFDFNLDEGGKENG